MKITIRTASMEEMKFDSTKIKIELKNGAIFTINAETESSFAINKIHYFEGDSRINIIPHVSNEIEIK